MLQQILQDMYVDPEILSELSEDQKQILFCKMREEQVRIWKEKEDALEKEGKSKKRKAPKPGWKKLNWLLGSDGKEWVWVMGDFKGDKSIEQIIEEEEQEEARKLAEIEAEELGKKAEEEMKKKLHDEQERLEREKKEKEAETKRKAEEAALYQSLKEAKLAAEELEKEKKRQEEQRHVQLRRIKEQESRKSEERLSRLRDKRTSEIYMSFKERKSLFEKTAEESSKKMEKEWEEQEKKSKAAETEIRAIARRAREEHRRSSMNLKTASKVIGALQRLSTDASAPPIPQKLSTKKRPQRPPNRQAIIEWFNEEEKTRDAGLEPKSTNVSPWFHGIISRIEAENILSNKKVGTFLVRVSERVWGYTISYKADDRCKHFLIDTSDGSYQFFGTNQIAHAKLNDLISFHKGKPISGAGQELLLFPCGQERDPPNYHDLFPNLQSHSTYL